MKRSRLNSLSPRKREELAIYTSFKNAIRSHWTCCARCKTPADGHELDPHHPYLRGSGKTFWKMLVIIPLCRPCHDWVHSHTNEARHEGFLIKNRNNH